MLILFTLSESHKSYNIMQTIYTKYLQIAVDSYDSSAPSEY